MNKKDLIFIIKNWRLVKTESHTCEQTCKPLPSNWVNIRALLNVRKPPTLALSLWYHV